MMKFAILFAIVATAVGGPVSHLNLLSPTGRIVGGVATSIDKVPYQISLQAFDTHMCGGSIISSTFILTAAHCLAWPVAWYTIRSGTALYGSGGTVSYWADVIPHTDFGYNDWRVPLNDIGLIRLNSVLTISSTQAPIALFSSGQEAIVGSPAVVTGWGDLIENGTTPDVLQTVTVPIVSKADCSAAYITTHGELPANQICAGLPEGGQDACQGDSGGPLAIDGVLAGIVSWGNGCARPGYFGVYTEVAAYRSWITENSGI